MSDLSLVPVDDLINEIASRCNGLLLVMDRTVDAGEPAVIVEFRGGATRAVGLARTAEHLCLDKVLKTFEE